MQSAKKTKRILSALSMAAAGALAAHTAHGMTLTMYYGNDPSYANSNNAIIVGTGFAPGGSGTDTTGATKYFSAETNVAVTGGVQTITIPVGDYVSLAIDALLTGNVNPDGGKSTGVTNTNLVQPSYLGLNALDVNVPESANDSQGNILTPIAPRTNAANTIGAPQNGFFGTVYYSSAILNQKAGANGGAGSASYNSIPVWGALADKGGIEPNNATNGYNSSAASSTNVQSKDSGTQASGYIGINADPSAGNSTSTIGQSYKATGVQQLTLFAASTSAANTTPSYANATDFVDSLIYQGLSTGLVTLSPTVNTAATSYWYRTSAGSGSSPTGYGTQGFNATAETITNVPMLVIDVVGTQTTSSAHAILALSATAGANYGSTVGTLSITGSAAGGYTLAQKTGLSSTTGNVGISTWNAGSDPEIYGVDVEVNGAQATAAQLLALINAINGGDGTPTSIVAGLTVSTTDPSGGHVLAALDTGTLPSSVDYNLFLDYTLGGFAPGDNLGLDLSQTNDSNLVGYTFTAVSVVPEPMSLGLLAMGGVGLMARRNRRKS